MGTNTANILARMVHRLTSLVAEDGSSTLASDFTASEEYSQGPCTQPHRSQRLVGI
jgi:hypothetical protein